MLSMETCLMESDADGSYSLATYDNGVTCAEMGLKEAPPLYELRHALTTVWSYEVSKVIIACVAVGLLLLFAHAMATRSLTPTGKR